MSRLIDVDKLLEELRQYHPLSLSYGILSDIEYFPTAYDVDKVIEQLENEAANNTEFFTDDYRDDYYRGAYAAYCEAIEIVKKGGQNER